MTDLKTLRLSPQELLAIARKETGIAIDDLDLHEPLAVYCNAVATQAELTEEGETLLLGKIKAFLKNRLRMARDFAAHPEIRDQTVTIGAVIFGAPRSGTSKLQKFLAASGDFNFMPLWQGLYPALMTGDRDESPALRIEKAKDWVRWNSARSPSFMAAHPFDAESADEEMFAVEQDFRFYTTSAYAEATTFIEWVLAQPPEKPLLFMKEVLQYLQWQGLAEEGKPWLLKCPAHLGFEPNFLSVFPEAKFLLPHRHPQETSASILGMAQAFRAPFSDKVPNGAFWLRQLPAFMDMHIANRNANSAIKVLDLDYLEVVSEPITAAHRIYKFLGMPLSKNALERVNQWDIDNPKGSHGTHKYSHEEFGLVWTDFIAGYQNYIDWLAQELPKMRADKP